MTEQILNTVRLRAQLLNFGRKWLKVRWTVVLGLLSLTLFVAGLFLVSPRAEAQGFEEIEPSRVTGRLGLFRSFGAARKFYRISAQPVIKLPLRASDVALLQPDSIRLFKLNVPKQKWELVADSKYDERSQTITASSKEAGIYTAIGASRFEEVLEAQQGVRADARARAGATSA